MSPEKFKQVYEDLLLVAEFHKLSDVRFVNFILDFIIINLHEDFDEEDARVFSHDLYLKIVKHLEKRNCKNG